MSEADTVSAALRAAWDATEYRVDTADGTLVLRTDAPSPTLAALMRIAGVDCAAYISADNPMSRVAPDAANAMARARLRSAVEAGGWRALPGLGIDPHGTHPGEFSLLVLGIPAPAALAIGRRFRQHAILLIGADAIPRLEILSGRGPPSPRCGR